jgi:hypothetical protein
MMARQPTAGFSASGFGDREHDDEVGDRAVADEPLRAVDDVLVAIPDGACPGPMRPSRRPPR